MKGSKEGVQLCSTKYFNIPLWQKDYSCIFENVYACRISDLKKINFENAKWKDHVFMSSYSVDPFLSHRTL